METDLFQTRYFIHYEHRALLNNELRKTDQQFPTCSKCDRPVDMGWLRKLDDQPLNEAVCLVCFLKDHTNTSQTMLDRMLQLCNENGCYKDVINTPCLGCKAHRQLPVDACSGCAG